MYTAGFPLIILTAMPKEGLLRGRAGVRYLRGRWARSAVHQLLKPSVLRVPATNSRQSRAELASRLSSTRTRLLQERGHRAGAHRENFRTL